MTKATKGIALCFCRANHSYKIDIIWPSRRDDVMNKREQCFVCCSFFMWAEISAYIDNQTVRKDAQGERAEM